MTLYVFLLSDSVDVNVTPDKRQIFVQEEKLLLAIIKVHQISYIIIQGGSIKSSPFVTLKHKSCQHHIC